MGFKYVLQLQVRVDLGLVVIKGGTHTPQTSKTGASPPDAIKCHT